MTKKCHNCGEEITKVREISAQEDVRHISIDEKGEPSFDEFQDTGYNSRYVCPECEVEIPKVYDEEDAIKFLKEGK